jgi:polar amino acid transport system substrate-binding protein/glutamate/aspartate transport system substrate-binding protein
LRRALTGTHLDAEIVLVKTNREGLDLLENGGIAAYFADRATLTFLMRKDKQAANLLLAETYLSVEPIALALRRGDSDFRLAVDTALSHIYRWGEITVIFKTAFGVLTTPSPMLAALFQNSGLPD